MYTLKMNLLSKEPTAENEVRCLLAMLSFQSSVFKVVLLLTDYAKSIPGSSVFCVKERLS